MQCLNCPAERAQPVPGCDAGRMNLAGRYVTVSGPGVAGDAELATARDLGRRLAGSGAIVLTGGLGGVMAATAEGVHEAGGTSIGQIGRAHV